MKYDPQHLTDPSKIGYCLHFNFCDCVRDPDFFSTCTCTNMGMNMGHVHI